MTELMDAVLTQLVKVNVRMPGVEGWDPGAFAREHGASEEEVQQALQDLVDLGLVQGHDCPGSTEFGAPSATDVGVQHLLSRVDPNAVLPGFAQVSVTVLEALSRQGQVTAAEAAQRTGLFGDELQAHLDLMRRLGLVHAVVQPGGHIRQVS